MGARSKLPLKKVLQTALSILPLFVYVWYRSSFLAAGAALLGAGAIGLSAWLFVRWHYRAKTGRAPSEMPADYAPKGAAVVVFLLILIVSGVWSFVFAKSI